MQNNEIHEEKNPRTRRRVLRLSLEADARLRDFVRRKGDISDQINKLILEANFSKVAVKPRPRGPGSGYKHLYTSIKILNEAYEKLKRGAKKKDVSIAVLLDTLIIEYFSKLKENQYGTSKDHRRQQPKRRGR